jgi:hypothetical protein
MRAASTFSCRASTASGTEGGKDVLVSASIVSLRLLGVPMRRFLVINVKSRYPVIIDEGAMTEAGHMRRSGIRWGAVSHGGG